MSTITASSIRLMSEMKSMDEESLDGVCASPSSDSNIFVWNATILGPECSPWEGGIFELELNFPDTYPDKPPKVKFVSPIFHPNVYGDGSLCLDIIQDKWSPIYTVSSILVAIRSLLTDPNPSSPANPNAATIFKEDMQEYNRRVKECVRRTIA